LLPPPPPLSPLPLILSLVSCRVMCVCVRAATAWEGGTTSTAGDSTASVSSSGTTACLLRSLLSSPPPPPPPLVASLPLLPLLLIRCPGVLVCAGKNSFGRRWHAGDSIGIAADVDARSLRYSCNGLSSCSSARARARARLLVPSCS